MIKIRSSIYIILTLIILVTFNNIIYNTHAADDGKYYNANVYVLGKHSTEEDKNIVTSIVGNRPLSISVENGIYVYKYDGFSIYSDMYGGYWIKGISTYENDNKNITQDVYLPIIYRLNKTIYDYSKKQVYITIYNITTESGEESLGGVKYKRVNNTLVPVGKIKPHVIRAYSVRITLKYNGIGEFTIPPYIVVDYRGRLVYGFFLVPRIEATNKIHVDIDSLQNKINNYLKNKYINYYINKKYGIGYCYISPSMTTIVDKAYLSPGYIIEATSNGAVYYIEALSISRENTVVFEIGNVFIGSTGAVSSLNNDNNDNNYHYTVFIIPTIASLTVLVILLFRLKKIY